jgi:antitoxin (DNA-binding transcriptional repressor) of toxin-antitoxin stability system
MDVISDLDLRNDTDGVLRRVEAGETLIVQSNRRSVAQLTPLSERPTWMPANRFFARVLARPADAKLREHLAELQPDTIEPVLGDERFELRSTDICVDGVGSGEPEPECAGGAGSGQDDVLVVPQRAKLAG